MAKKALKIVAVVLAAIPVFALVAVAALVLYARSDGGRERLRLLVLDKARASIPGLEMKRIGGDYLHDLVVEDVTIRDRQGRPAVHVDRVTARFSLVPLVRKRLFVRELIVEGPRVFGRPDADGTLNLSQLTAPGKEPRPDAAKKPGSDTGSPIAIQVDRLVVARGTADVETAAGQSFELKSLELLGSLLVVGQTAKVELLPLTAAAELEGQPYRVELRTRAQLSAQEIHAALDRLTIQGVAPRGAMIALSGEAGGRLEDLGFRLEVSLPEEGSVRANGRVGLLPDGGGLGKYLLDLNAARVDPSAVVATAPPGLLAARLTARGSGTPLAPGSRAAFTLSVPPSRIADIRIVEVQAEGNSEGDAWKLPRLLVRGAGAELNARGEGRGNELATHLRASVGDPSDGKLPSPDFRGKGVLVADLRGTMPDDLTFEATASGKRLKIGTASIGSLALRANGSASKATRKMALVAKANVRKVIAGTTKVRAAAMTVNAEGPFQTPRGKVMLAARGVAAGAEAPPMDRVLVELSSDGKNLRVHGAAMGPGARGGIDAHGQVSPRRATVTLDRFSIDLRGPRLTQAVALQAPTTVEWRADDLIQIGRTRLRARGSKLSGDLAISGMYRLDLRGRLEPRATAALSVRMLVVNGLDPLDADGWLKLGRKQLQAGLDATSLEAKLHLDTDIPLIPGRGSRPPRLAKDGPLAVRLNTNRIKLAALPLLHKQLARRGLSGGTLSLTASVSGDVAHPDAKVAFDLREVELRKVTGQGRDSVVRRIPGVGATVTIDTRRGSIEADGEAKLYGAGFVKIDSLLKADLGEILAGADPSAAPLEVDVTIPRFQIASLKGYFEQLRDSEGVLAGQVALRGSLLRPTGRGAISISNARVDKLRFGPIEARGSSDGQKITGDLTIHQHQGGRLVAHADIDRTGQQPMAATARVTKLDITFARLFTTGVREIAGVVDADVQARGTLARPQVQGAVYYYGGRLGVVGQPTFHDVAVTLALKPDKVEIQKLQAFSGGGAITGKGWLTIDAMQPTGMVLTAHAHRFVVAAAGSTGARLDGDLAVAAELKEAVIAGKVKIPQASVWLPKVGPSGKKLQKIGQHDDIRFVDQAARAAAEKQRETKMKPADQPRKLDIRATAGTVFVRAKDLDIELDSNLHVTSGRGGNPVINGTVDIRRGRINITGQRFDFEPSQISFDGDVDPALAIRITHQYPEALVAVEIRGTPKKPALRLVSDPPIYDQAQIVSLVMTGQPGGQPSNGGSFDPTAAIATAVLGKLADKIAPLGLDVLRLESVKEKSDEGGATGDSETRIEVGKYISERVYLSYAHVFGSSEGQNRNEAHVEYRVTRRWLVETVFGDAGVGGVDALWTYRY